MSGCSKHSLPSINNRSRTSVYANNHWQPFYLQQTERALKDRSTQALPSTPKQLRYSNEKQNFHENQWKIRPGLLTLNSSSIASQNKNTSLTH